MTDQDINININVNVNLSVKINWADVSEMNLVTDLYKEIEDDTQELNKRKQEVIMYIEDLVNNMDVSFEPDETYRENVKYMILGLVLCQLLKQKTINIYRKGKEDREYLASFLMMKIQNYLSNKFSTDVWEEIIKDVYKHYDGKIRINENINNVIRAGIAKKIISPDVLVSTIITNKKCINN